MIQGQEASQAAAEGYTMLPEVAAALPKRGLLQRYLRLALRKPMGAFGAFIIIATVVTAIFAPIVATYDPAETHFQDRLHRPSSKYLLGTDHMGRDILSRVVYGSRVSLQVGITAVGVAVFLGSALGIISGFYGRTLDIIIQRWMDIQMSIPGIILAMVVVAVLGGGLMKLMIVLGIFLMPGWSRVIRGSTLSIKENQYIEAARVLGGSDLRIMFFHVLPNIVPTIIILGSTGLASAILAEAALSFLGLGASPDTITWGGMLSRDARTFFERAWWMATAPGVAISLVVLGFNLLGDALRDVWDPRLRGV